MNTYPKPKPKANYNQIAEELDYNGKSVGQIQRSIAALRQDKHITNIPEWAVATAGKPFDVQSIDKV